MLTQGLARIKPSYRRWIRLALGLFLVLALGWVALLLVVRIWIWPSVPQWAEQAKAGFSQSLSLRGVTLQAGPVVADWANPWTPRIRLVQLEFYSAKGERTLEVKEIQAVLGLRSIAALWHQQPVFSQIHLRSPRIVVERQASGLLSFAGLTPDTSEGESRTLTWLLRQGGFSLDDATLVWRDAARQKSTSLSSVSASMNNFYISHRWKLQATPDQSLGDRFRLDGKFRHSVFGSAADLSRWVGKADVAFTRVDLSRLFDFIHLPKAFRAQVLSGQGALKASVAIDEATIDHLELEVDLNDVAMQWGKTRPPLRFRAMNGRIESEVSALRQTIHVRDLKLTAPTLPDSLSIPSARVEVEQNQAGDSTSVRVDSKSLNLNSGIWLMSRLPLPPRWLQAMDELQPRGELSQFELRWRESAGVIQSFALESDFSNMALQAGATRPGAQGVSGSVKATEGGGEIQINSRQVQMSFPSVFPTKDFSFETLEARAHWTSQDLFAAEGSDRRPELNLTIREVAASNADLSVATKGTYRWAGQGAGEVDLTGKILRASPSRIHVYLPLSVGPDTRTWITNSLLDSKPYTGEYKLQGKLADFPFRDPSQGVFWVKAKTADGRIRPAPGWPEISKVKADVTFERQQFRLEASSAEMSRLALSGVTASVEDLNAWHPILNLKGELSGDVQNLIDGVNQSPLLTQLDGITSEMSGRGAATLALSMALDLTESKNSKVNANLRLGKGEFRYSKNLPVITVSSGSAAISRRGLESLELQGQALGGAIQVSKREGASVHQHPIEIQGQAQARGLERWVAESLGPSIEDRLSGQASYRASIKTSGSGMTAAISSDLVGLASKLPSPLRKSATDSWAMLVSLDQSSGSQSWKVRTNQPNLNAVIRRAGGDQRETLIDLESPTAAGQIRWFPARQHQANLVTSPQSRQQSPLLQAKLSRLWLERAQSNDGNTVAPPSESVAQSWPRVNLEISDFRVGERRWGRLELEASPDVTNRAWNVEQFTMMNSDATLNGKGQWSMFASPAKGAPRSRTTLDLKLKISNAGALLKRSGYPGVVRDTKGEIEGRLLWPGSPLEFSGAALSGTLKLDLEQGQFLKTEPGLARLIGVVNLQSLTRRIKLDFRDVFSEGFTYERIRGNLEFLSGQASTQNLRIIGVQASVLLEGSANLRDETQNLRVLVLPEVNAGLASLGYAALVNPAVGLGAFLAQYVLRNPVREILSYEYQVTGRWDEPVVTPVKRQIDSNRQEMRSSDPADGTDSK
jgi:uncharacterized protein YhdP